MTLNYDGYDVEKYKLKWLRVLCLCERTWVQVLYVSNCVLFNYYCFNNMLKHVSYDIILELCKLARNMSWPDGKVERTLAEGAAARRAENKY